MSRTYPESVQKRLSDDERRGILDALAQPGATVASVALQFRVATKTVSRAKAAAAAKDSGPAGVSSAGAEIIKRIAARTLKALPLDTRVSLYVQIASGLVDPKAAYSMLSALKRIEELEGVVTDKERRAIEATAPPGPMFILPASTEVSVMPFAHTIDVTPNASSAPNDSEEDQGGGGDPPDGTPALG